MPHHARSTKRVRDQGILDGLSKHSARLSSMARVMRLASPDQLGDRFRAHLAALNAVEQAEAALAEAVAVERRLEAAVKAYMPRLRSLLEGAFDGDLLTLHDFAIKPRRRTRPSAETLRGAVEKRRETRKLRGTMGKKQRRAIKAKG
jgi:hypothetical protein